MTKIIFFVCAAFFFFTLYFHNVIEFDQDLGRHLLTGQIIWQTHEVPKVNLFSYTHPNFPFINSHWLSEVIFYFVGLANLVYFKTAILTTAMTLTLYTAYKFSKNLITTALAFAVFAPVLLERTEIRPEIFSYLFISVFLFILLRHTQRHPELVSGSLNSFENSHSREMLKLVQHDKLLWLLPILQIIWVNSHIYFVLGPVLTLIFLRFSPITLLVFLATLINPNGLTGAIYPLTVFSNYGYSIVENQNIFFLRELVFNPNIFYFGVAVILFLASFLFVDRKKLSLSIILNSLFIILPVWHIRSFPLLFLIELPIFAYCLAHFRNNILAPLEQHKYVRILLGFVIFLTLFRSYRLISNQYYQSIGSSKRFGTEIKESYKKGVDFILTNSLHGPIFNDFDLGSYLDYRLYPKEKVFVDGRPEAYPVEFFQNMYIPMQQTPENFAIVDQIYKFNLIIFSRTDATPWGRQFLTDILQNKSFPLVYIDDNLVVLSRQENLPGAKIPQPTQNLFIPAPGLILF